MIFNEYLTKLRTVLYEESTATFRKNHRLSPHDFAKQFLRRHHDLVVDALADLTCNELEHANDVDLTAQVLKRRPELQKLMEGGGFSQVSETLGVPLYFLLELDGNRMQSCFMAVELIHGLRIEEKIATRDAMIRAQEFLRPVTNGHPDMTVGEAVRLLNERTNETIRGLESEGL